MLHRLLQLLLTIGGLVVAVTGGRCTDRCSCARIDGELVVHCRYQRLTELPGEFPNDTAVIDLSYNHIKTFHTSAFKGLTKLHTILISHNALTDIVMNYTLSQLQTLDLSYNEILEIPVELSDVLPNLEELNLQHNGIAKIRKGTFKYMNIQSCNLAYNNISALSTGSFLNTTIKELDLSFNNISGILENTFSNFTVSALNLEHNPLLNIPDGTFSDQNLKGLNLKSCNLTSHTFIKYLNVLKLDLSDNQFEDLDFSQYVSLHGLDELKLSGYDIYEFNSETFSKMVNLKKLDLSDNNLMYIDISPFPNMPHLEILDLSKNQLADLPSGFCSTFVNLKELHLNLNQLQKISYHNFKDCVSLQTLDLRNNRIQTFAEVIKPIFSNLQSLSLGDNPIHCNCEMAWFSEWSKTSRIFTGADFCETPNKAYMFQMEVEDFTCTPPVITYHSANLETPEGRDVVLHCVAEGDPAPEIDWLSPYGELIRISPPSDRTVNMTQAYWSLHDLHTAQAGLYKCIASNPAGNVTAHMMLTVTERHTTQSVEQKETTTSVATDTFVTPTSASVELSSKPDNLSDTDFSSSTTVDLSTAVTNSSKWSSESNLSTMPGIQILNNATSFPVTDLINVTSSSTSAAATTPSYNLSSLVPTETSLRPTTSLFEEERSTISSLSPHQNVTVSVSSTEIYNVTSSNIDSVAISSSSVFNITSSVAPKAQNLNITEDYRTTVPTATANVPPNEIIGIGGETDIKDTKRNKTSSISNMFSVLIGSINTVSKTSQSTTLKLSNKDAVTMASAPPNATRDSLVETRSPSTDRNVIITVIAVIVVLLALLSGIIVGMMILLRRKQSKQFEYEIGGKPTASTETICKEQETEA